MSRLPTRVLVLLGTLILAGTAWSQVDTIAGSELTPKHGIESALERASASSTVEPGPDSSRWLGAVPTLSISQIESRDPFGTDETELALNLPLRSPARARADARLRVIDTEMTAARLAVRRLFYSGLIREAWWSWRLASLELDGVQDRIGLLQDLVERQERLARAGNLPAFSLLLVRRELISARSEAVRLDSELARWQARYEQITGFPPRMNRASDRELDHGTPSVERPVDHPSLALLELELERQQALLDANTSSADDWSLGLVGRRQNMPGFTDEQIGITLEIPLSFVPVISQYERSDRRAASREYLKTREEFLAEIESRSTGLRAERLALEAELGLLQEAVSLDDQIAEQLSALATGSAIESELLLRRRLDLLTTRLQLRLTEARLGQNLDLWRQTLGVPL
ncbi:MAG: TolC family protein [Wenzhouxiangella sp.]|nr:TolC family protein [Wenzhouxiangella sp.]